MNDILAGNSDLNDVSSEKYLTYTKWTYFK